LRAKEIRRARRKRKPQQRRHRQPRPGEVTESSKSDSDWNAGYSSADSVGDDESVESMILDPGDEVFGIVK